jgi:ApaG protein
VLAPGQSFEYTSFCPLPTPVGSMHGSYWMVRPGGEGFEARIAPFSLEVPGSVN